MLNRSYRCKLCLQSGENNVENVGKVCNPNIIQIQYVNLRYLTKQYLKKVINSGIRHAQKIRLSSSAKPRLTV
jgi:hypothetical protein